MASFVSLHFCILVYMFMNVSLYACSCHQALFLLIISCGFALVFVHKISSPFRKLCLVAHVSSILQYNGTLDIKSKPTFVLLGHPLFLYNMLVCPFVCLLLLVCPFVCFLCFFVISFAYLLALFSLLLHVHAWSEGATSKMQAKNGK